MIRHSDDPYEVKLPFPTRPLEVADGVVVEEYIIPPGKRQEVLEQLYLGDDVPSLDEELFDLHEGKTFKVRDYRVTWENGRNWLVSPYYPNSGGTVIDWMPASWAEAEEDEMDEWDEEDDVDDEAEDKPFDEDGTIPF